MTRHILASFAAAGVLMAGTVVLVFTILSLTPGDPIQAIVGEHTIPDALRASLETQYHLNDPFPRRLFFYFVALLHGDLGTSFSSQVPVADLILERAPRTILLAGSGLGVALLIGLAVGIATAWTRSRRIASALTVMVLVGYSVPTFWLGQIAVTVFAMRLGWFPTQGMGPRFSFATGGALVLERLPYLVLPMLTYAIHEGARIARLMRVSVAGTLRQTWIATARMKGLSEAAVLRGHVLRNSMLPVVTATGTALGTAMGGAVLIETVFSWPGIGLLLVDAIRAHDNQLVVGIVLFIAAAVTTASLVVEILYAWLDPRIRRRH